MGASCSASHLSLRMSSPWRFDLLCLLARFRSRSLKLLTTTADLEGEVVQGVHARIRTFGQLGPDPLPPITTLLRDLRPTLPGSLQLGRSPFSFGRVG